MTSFAHTGSTFEKVVSNEMCGILFCTSYHKLLIDIINSSWVINIKGIYDVIFVNRK